MIIIMPRKKGSPVKKRPKKIMAKAPAEERSMLLLLVLPVQILTLRLMPFLLLREKLRLL